MGFNKINYIRHIFGKQSITLRFSHYWKLIILQTKFANYKFLVINVLMSVEKRENVGEIAVVLLCTCTVHNSLLNGIKKIPSSGTENIVIKLSKTFFGLKKTLLCALVIVCLRIVHSR